MHTRQNHELPSFSGYLRKVFHFRKAVASLRDGRQDPDISPQTVFLALFHGFVFRLSSFLQLEADLAQPHLQHCTEAPRAFGDDVLRYSLASFTLEPLEQMLVNINRRLKRNKALDPGRVQGRVVAALDGIEVLSSFSRCCEFCLQRRVVSQDEQGQPVEQIQYYHRLVGCQVVSSPVKPILALEWVRPGEGEDTAALRLLRRLPELYGSRFFDILLLDSLYAQAPVLQLAKEIDWDLVITLKQENRTLYQDAHGLFQGRVPDDQLTEKHGNNVVEAQLWQAEDLPFTEEHPQPMRVVRSEERKTEWHYRKGKRVSETKFEKWVWITTLDAKTFSIRLVRQLGHDRWRLENNAWCDLTKHWALKHGFLHACKHRPQRRDAEGQLQPLPNHGLQAVTLILCIAFVLCSAFARLHSKLFRRYRISLLEISRQLYRSLWSLQPPIRAPDG
jgi:hypothetical protein